MNALDNLMASVGEWHGVNRLWTSPSDRPAESTSVASVAGVLGGRFVRIDQLWAYGGDAQSGSMLVGFDRDTKAASLHWVDTFHMGCKVMACVGAAVGEGVIDVLGRYAAPPGPDWGWRIRVTAASHDQLVLLMYNIHPDGKEELAVEATHRRCTATV